MYKTRAQIKLISGIWGIIPGRVGKKPKKGPPNRGGNPGLQKIKRRPINPKKTPKRKKTNLKPTTRAILGGGEKFP